jgi:holo-[acyl-carrier protein] synthase
MPDCEGSLLSGARAPGQRSGQQDADVILGVGTDLAEVERYRFNQERLAWFGRRVYTDEEMAYAMRKRHWAERLAGFFAAKEAARKAFGFAIPWRDIGVSHERSGRPILKFFGEATDLPQRFGVVRLHLTITHTATTAAAFVILEGN